MALDTGDTAGTAVFDLPPELRNRITRFEIAGERSAGAVTLTDDALQRREVALIDAQGDDEGQALLSPLHYLRQALAPTADLMEGALSDMLLASPDALILADIATLSPDEESALIDWVERGGLLVRFAGPRLAASDVARDAAGPLMPVRLRVGGRTVGGAMSWGEPKALSPFPETRRSSGSQSPRRDRRKPGHGAARSGLLSERTIASLTDGTPLVTRAPLGAGERGPVPCDRERGLVEPAPVWPVRADAGTSGRVDPPRAARNRRCRGITWVPEQVLDGFGTLRDAGIRPGVPGEIMVDRAPVGGASSRALRGGGAAAGAQCVTEETELSPATWPASIPGRRHGRDPGHGPHGGVPCRALACLLVDALAALWLAGRLSGTDRSHDRARFSRPAGAEPLAPGDGIRAGGRRRRWPDAGRRACASGHVRSDAGLRDDRRSGT
jgi:hypothetical protein